MEILANFVPFLVLILWLSLITYLILLGTRLVKAVEQIAAALAARAPNPEL